MKKYCLFVLLLMSMILSHAQDKQPNVIIILADDLGWADLTCYGSSFYETPNLDKLAAQGIRFTHAYATSPVCSPTRSSLLTGKSPVKTGVTDWIKGRQEDGKAKPYEKLVAKPTAYQLKPDETTIAEYAVANGYKTFFAGKWHLGEEEKHWPQSEGFRFNKGGWSKGGPTGKVNDSTGGFFTPYSNPTLSDGPAGEYLTDRLTNECLNFLDKNENDRFLMMYSLYAVHNPMQAPADLIRKYQEKRKQLNFSEKDRFAKDEAWMKNENGWRRRVVQDLPVYAAMVENMDTNIGKILERLKQLGLDDNTIIIFTSDNGGLSTAEGSPTTNGPLRNGKGWLYEGGIRVPFIMYWKGKFTDGLVSDMPVTISDLYPTIAQAINANYVKDKTIDGDNIAALLSKQAKTFERSLYWHYPHYSNQGGKPGSAIRKGNLKLIYNYEDQSVELYDVVKDVGEKNNLALTHTKKARQLHKELMQWLKKNDALLPDLNPAYRP